MQIPFYSLNKNLASHYIKLLSSNDKTGQCWKQVIYLEKVLPTDKLKAIKQYYFELLNDKSHEIRENAWDAIKDMVHYDIITGRDQNIFLNLLQNEDNDHVRKNTWTHVSQLIELKIITPDDLEGKKRYLFELLESENNWNKLEGTISAVANAATSTINDNSNGAALAMMSNFGIPLTSSMSVSS
jgi:hypothetical protein